MPATDAERRRQLTALLGRLPAARPPTARLLGKARHPGFLLEHLELDLNGVEPVPAWLLVPDERAEPAAGLLYLHAHGGAYGLGKQELLLGRKVLPAYAPVCRELGLVTLVIDAWCHGERQHDAVGPRGESDTFKRMLWQGQVLWGMMVFDDLQALTYLCSRPEVDARRVGAFGLSMGATRAWWLAALDERVRLCIDLCCLTDFDELIRTGNLRGHGIYYYVPSLLEHFSAGDINALIAPRRRLSLNGRRDALTPPAGVERIREQVLPLYARGGCEADCRIELFDCGHEETPAMRALVREWLGRL
jgi:hypothetical protein